MVGKNRYSSSLASRERSPKLLIIIASLLSLFCIVIFFSSSSPSTKSSLSLSLPNPNRNSEIENSFVASLENFLNNKLPKYDFKDDTVRDETTEESSRRLDNLIWKREDERLYGIKGGVSEFFPGAAIPIRVYVYDMPKKFTTDLLWLFRNSYRETSDLTSNGSPVHRLIEQHSIDYWLWADLIAPESERLLKNVVRVRRQEDADFFYIPFFTTISFFLLEKQQCKALYRVKH